MELSHWTNLIYDKLEGWTTIFIKMLPNLVLAIIVVAAGYFLAKLIRNVSYKVTQRVSSSDSVSGVVSVILQTLTNLPDHL